MLQYKNVTKIFSKDTQTIHAVDHINLEIHQGECVVFLGPSGCGKSTTLRLTNRLETLTSGKILYHDQDITHINPTKLRQSMGYVIQDIGLFPNKTIEENITLLPKVLGWSKKQRQARAEELLEMVNLSAELYLKSYPHQLSGGQQQRVGVVRALATDPDVLLMDEPFGAIDPINREQIQDEFLNLQKKMKKTIIMVSHDLHEAIKMADRIVIFNRGRIIQCDTPEHILTQPKNKFVADFVGADRALKVMSLIRARDAMDLSDKNIINADMLAPESLKYLESHKLNFAFVLDKGKPIGFVTPKLLKYENGPAKDVANPLPMVSYETHTLKETLSNMLLSGCNAVPVLDATGNYKGTLKYTDIHAHIVSIYDEGSS